MVGADGRNSVVARAVQPEQYEDRPPLTVGYYSYWSNLPTDTFEAYSRPGRGWAVCPTNDDLTLVIGGWPHAELTDHRDRVEETLMDAFAHVGPQLMVIVAEPDSVIVPRIWPTMGVMGTKSWVTRTET